MIELKSKSNFPFRMILSELLLRMIVLKFKNVKSFDFLQLFVENALWHSTAPLPGLTFSRGLAHLLHVWPYSHQSSLYLLFIQ